MRKDYLIMLQETKEKLEEAEKEVNNIVKEKEITMSELFGEIDKMFEENPEWVEEARKKWKKVNNG